jgi:hypothetical protein
VGSRLLQPIRREFHGLALRVVARDRHVQSPRPSLVLRERETPPVRDIVRDAFDGIGFGSDVPSVFEPVDRSAAEPERRDPVLTL